ncbi:MAG: hypothetical protein ABS943_22400 [Pantoea agglomerans]
MNTNAQMPSGIDFFDFPDDDALKETMFLIYSSMTAEEMNLALEAEWKIYKASNGARDFLRRAEKRLDSLDDPFTGWH